MYRGSLFLNPTYQKSSFYRLIVSTPEKRSWRVNVSYVVYQIGFTKGTSYQFRLDVTWRKAGKVKRHLFEEWLLMIHDTVRVFDVYRVISCSRYILTTKRKQVYTLVSDRTIATSTGIVGRQPAGEYWITCVKVNSLYIYILYTCTVDEFIGVFMPLLSENRECKFRVPIIWYILILLISAWNQIFRYCSVTT